MTTTVHPALRVAVASDVGLRRGHNEDASRVGPRMLAVADGMGGHVHGELASATAVAVLTELDDGLPDHPLSDEEMTAVLTGATVEIARRLNEQVAADEELRGMGTTLVATLWSPGLPDGTGPRFALAHVGDSRAYRLRDGALHPLTRDHTFVQGLLDEQRITPAEAAVHPRRSMLMRALQTGSPGEPDLSVHETLPGDRYLLCSDGLTDVTPEDAVRDALVTAADPDAAVARLVELARAGGGPDNCTCIVADVLASGAARQHWWDRLRRGRGPAPTR